MIYKKGPRFQVRPHEEIESDLWTARRTYGERVKTLFLPAGNTIAMPTARLAAVCRSARRIFPKLERITVYGSSQYIHQKGLADLKQLAEAGLSRIHVGLESGDDEILKQIRKGTHAVQQIEAGQWVKSAGIELSLYVILGIGGRDRSKEHAMNTAACLNAIDPHFIRLRTFVPKINTPMLEDVQNERFSILGPHEVLQETALLIRHLAVTSQLTSDHYTNYINLHGAMPSDRWRLMKEIEIAMELDQAAFRPHFVGTT